ncbi:AfsR family transcriptional regulator [Streptomyces cirratus]|uniref:AfsR family transcriptional regulator n=1 Tax=Streptomyces cirratus TaxID=68187 RepID=A0ABQ3EZ92_9ACTN|nr:BTAD domain-containing putative transcriptional regulator [Streptomyces cirratus]GHB64804.1 AfsR family transcriptional regulator [Streptomyces cirratus]
MRYLILGPSEARDATGAPLPIGGARLRALLTALALRAGAPAAATVADLVDEVWGDDPPQDAPAALQALVSRLRRALGSRDAVLADPTGGYRLGATRDDVDLHRFTRLAREAARHQDPAATLRSALALWRGPALADLPEPARTAHAAAPEALRSATLRARIAAELTAGTPAPATLLPELEALIHENPYDEPLHALHLRALRAAGRPAEALAAYEATRRALAEGLGADPGPELRALHAELLRPPPPEQRRPTGNLRPRLTSFVGREPELAALRTDLARSRLVTLTGPGGSGKTRLAEHAAAAHPEPGWLVELARLDHPAAVPGAVLSALGLRENALVAHDTGTASADPATLLVEHCADRRMLLVLDNCEHVIDAAAELADRLLTHCPGLRILATSREPLGVPGEALRPVEPLPPAPAHRLFTDRATAARPGFDPADDPDAVTEICARLDGLPLAIELAAARLRLLTPRQIADRLDDRFRLLTGGSRTLLPRQQTLRAVVDWSWELLTEPERTVLRRLSVFSGGCDLAAAEAVCAGPGLDVADALGSLVDKSLVLAEPGPDGMRYRMLETIREYAAERALTAPADAEATARRHTARFLALAEEAEPHLRSATQIPWIRRIETELDNLRAAFEHAVDAADTDTAQRLTFALGWFWWLRHYRTEGAEWAARVLALTPDAPAPDAPAPEGSPAYRARARLEMLHLFLTSESQPPQEFHTPEYADRAARITGVLRGGGPESTRFPNMLWPMTAHFAAPTAEFLRNLDESVQNCRRHGTPWELGVTLLVRAHFAMDTTGGLPTVETDLAELRDLARRVGDRWTRSQVAGVIGEFAISRGQYGLARTAYEECLDLAREAGADSEVPFVLTRLAECDFCAGDFERAERTLTEADREAEQYGAMHDVRAYSHLLTALIALFRGQEDHARTRIDLARAEAAKTSAPPQLTTGLDNVDAVLTGREHGPRAGLDRIGPALEAAVTAHCAERVLASLAETAAVMLAPAGRHAESVRVLAAATAWRAGYPRSVPETAALHALPGQNLAVLGPARYAEEETAGAALTPHEVAGLLTRS